MTHKKVWFVTGCSKGLGHALVHKLLEEGYPVAATSRNAQSLIQHFGPERPGFLPLTLDLRDEKAVGAALGRTKETFGRIDVVVNNAGYTHLATLEEMSDAEARSVFDINVFGLLNVIRHVLPILRAQKSGHIFNVSSLGAYNVGALSGIYCATKHAVKAISETLALEVQPYGIHVTDVKPGFMRTEFFGTSYQTTAPEHSAYQHIYQENMDFYMGQNGTQIGDPEKAAALYIQVAEMENPYESLPMGSDSCRGIRTVCANTVEQMDAMEEIAASTDY